jgi:SAM-dependent methyltransferase
MGHRRVTRYWDRLGRCSPLEAVLTSSQKAGEVEWSLDRFFATGRDDAARFVEDLSVLVPSAGRRCVLDFGCGVGRVTRALTDYFESAIGVDASRSMIEQARRLNADYSRCEFVLNRASHLRQFASGSFDVIYSRLVLQHLPPRSVCRYIAELLRLLAPNGCLMFQLPDVICRHPEDLYCAAPVVGSRWRRAVPRPIVWLYRRYKYRVVLRNSLHRMEMFGLARETVAELIENGGGHLTATRPDQSHGLPTPGFEYWITR